MMYKDLQKTNTLKIIRFLESNDGRYVKHKSSAKGAYGIMPKFLKDVKKHFNYKKVIVNDDKKASISYDFLVQKMKTNNPYYIAYAWYNGAYKLKPIPYRRPNIYKHWYVERFHKAYVNKILGF